MNTPGRQVWIKVANYYLHFKHCALHFNSRKNTSILITVNMTTILLAPLNKNCLQRKERANGDEG